MAIQFSIHITFCLWKIYIPTLSTLYRRLASGAIPVAQQRCRDQPIDSFAIGRRSVHGLRTYSFAGKRCIEKLDTVFNYGIFDFSKPNFIYRFAKGETDYRLAAQYTRDFLIEYEMRGSEVTEQILDIDSAGKARIWEALMINNRPENRVYRYNFFSTIVQRDPLPSSRSWQVEK